MVGADDLDRRALHLAAEILDRHLGRLDRPFAAEIGIDAGLVIEDADLDFPIGNSGGRGGDRGRGEKRGRNETACLHSLFPPVMNPTVPPNDHQQAVLNMCKMRMNGKGAACGFHVRSLAGSCSPGGGTADWPDHASRKLGSGTAMLAVTAGKAEPAYTSSQS
jgi:hypothetical protein